VAVEVLEAFGERLSGVRLIPSHGGVFTVHLGEELLFRKADVGRFPDRGEIQELVAPKLR